MFEVLVLGATGFVGGHIAKAALRAGWRVRGFRRRPQSTGHLQNQEIRWYSGNLEDHASLVNAMEGADFVFHAAAYYPQSASDRSFKEHITHAKKEISNVLSAAHAGKIRRLIYTSSLSTIGRPPESENRLADERDVYQPGTYPKNAYYECKSIMERAVLTAVDKGMDAVIVNPTAVFGPGDVHLTTGRILIAVSQGKVLASPPGHINIIDARDVGKGHIAAARTGRRGERYILGGDNFTIHEALTIMAEIAGSREPLFTLPSWTLGTAVAIGKALPLIRVPNHLGAYHHWQAYNTQKAEEQLGLNTRWLFETVRDSLKWYRDEGKL